MVTVTSQRLNHLSFHQAVSRLTNKDRDLRKVISTYGLPPFWQRPPGFQTLLYIILEQQVSLASARAALNKLLARINPLTAENFINVSEQELKAFGFSRQKALYTRILAGAVIHKHLDLHNISKLNDDEARKELMKIKGIGLWTADIYLLLAMRRPDIWPSTDLALAVAVQHLKALPGKPSPSELDNLSERWQPWRAVAARLLWHFYLNCRQ